MPGLGVITGASPGIGEAYAESARPMRNGWRPDGRDLIEDPCGPRARSSP
jgi:hypothetical protein